MDNPLIHNRNVTKGIFWFVFSGFFSGVMINMAKHVIGHMHMTEVIFIRNVFAFAMFLPIMYFTGFGHFRTARLSVHLARSSSGLCTMMLYFYCVSIMKVADVTAISFTTPLFTAVFAIYILKDKFNRHQAFALFLGFIGVMVVVQPGTTSFDPHSLLMLIASFFWGVSSIIIKKLSKTETPMQTTFYMTFFMMSFSAPMAIYKWHNPSLDDCIWLFFVALASNLMQYGLAKALKFADFSVLLPIDFTRLIFSAGIAYFAFGEKMSVNTLLGAIVILSAAFYSVINERRKQRRLAAASQVLREF